MIHTGAETNAQTEISELQDDAHLTVEQLMAKYYGNGNGTSAASDADEYADQVLTDRCVVHVHCHEMRTHIRADLVGISRSITTYTCNTHYEPFLVFCSTLNDLIPTFYSRILL